MTPTATGSGLRAYRPPHPRLDTVPGTRPGALDTCAGITFTVTNGQIQIIGDLLGPMDLLLVPELAGGEVSDWNVAVTQQIKAGAQLLSVTRPSTHPLHHVSVHVQQNHTDLDVCWAYHG